MTEPRWLSGEALECAATGAPSPRGDVRVTRGDDMLARGGRLAPLAAVLRGVLCTIARSAGSYCTVCSSTRPSGPAKNCTAGRRDEGREEIWEHAEPSRPIESVRRIEAADTTERLEV